MGSQKCRIVGKSQPVPFSSPAPVFHQLCCIVTGPRAAGSHLFCALLPDCGVAVKAQFALHTMHAWHFFHRSSCPSKARLLLLCYSTVLIVVENL
jgi:hypothetical protein